MNALVMLASNVILLGRLLFKSSDDNCCLNSLKVSTFSCYYSSGSIQVVWNYQPFFILTIKTNILIILY